MTRWERRMQFPSAPVACGYLPASNRSVSGGILFAMFELFSRQEVSDIEYVQHEEEGGKGGCERWVCGRGGQIGLRQSSRDSIVGQSFERLHVRSVALVALVSPHGEVMTMKRLHCVCYAKLNKQVLPFFALSSQSLLIATCQCVRRASRPLAKRDGLNGVCPGTCGQDSDRDKGVASIGDDH